ncbi:MAG TPA: ATP-binding protein [Gaiellaceae bacterium]|nr:ATP-binding protein [Gaiellaceae bacterium]
MPDVDHIHAVHSPEPDAPSVLGAVGKFVLAGLVALAVFLVGALVVLRDLGESEALRDARQFAVLSGQGIVEPELRDEIVNGDRAAIDAIDLLVQERVLGERIVRVKIWTLDGHVVYSDEPRLIGSSHPLDDSKVDVLRTGTARAELSDLSGAENRFEQGLGDLYEVYLPIRTPNGMPLLFETYQASAEVASTGRRIWLPFAALLLVSLVLLWLVQVPLAWRLAERLRRSQRDREALLVRAAEASTDERRRIAGDLHDSVVQDLAGISYSLSAAADRADSQTPAELRETLRDGATGTRDSMRRLRSLLVEIHPPNLRATGLDAALGDLLAALPRRGVETSLDVDGELHLSEDAEQLVYRAAGEAIRNVEKHAAAARVSVRLTSTNGAAWLEVVDDGAGFAPEVRERRRAEGHVGLSLVADLAARMDGRLEVQSSPGSGTRFVLEVPL